MRKNLKLALILLGSCLFLLNFNNHCFAEIIYKLQNNSDQSFQDSSNGPEQESDTKKLDQQPAKPLETLPPKPDKEAEDSAAKALESKTPQAKLISNNGLSLDKIDQSRFMNIAELQGLNKITAKTSILRARVGEPIKFGNLLVIIDKCWQAPISQRPDSKILLEIFEIKHNADNSETKERIFYGWLIASDPAVSALEHPIYDITALSCSK